jgi:prepilin-type processing-associated H-X9-DG protein
MTGEHRRDLRFTSDEAPDPRPSDAVPPWFTAAITTPYDIGSVDVDGVTIAYRAWGDPGDPVVLLVHGGGANAAWWDHVGPLLSAGRRVVAPDLSGHGDSDWRPSYGFDLWAEEIIAVAEAEGATAPIFVGHSMGGGVCLTAAHRLGRHLRAVAVIDSLIDQITPDVRMWITERAPAPPHRVHARLEDAASRFQPRPADETALGWVVEHIATSSLRRVAGGWRWKFDPHVYYDARMEPHQVRPVTCRVAFVAGERGLASPAIVDDVIARSQPDAVRAVIPDAGHHIMLEQPVALIAVLRTLFATWNRHDDDRPEPRVR